MESELFRTSSELGDQPFGVLGSDPNDGLSPGSSGQSRLSPATPLLNFRGGDVVAHHSSDLSAYQSCSYKSLCIPHSASQICPPPGNISSSVINVSSDSHQTNSSNGKHLLSSTVNTSASNHWPDQSPKSKNGTSSASSSPPQPVQYTAILGTPRNVSLNENYSPQTSHCNTESPKTLKTTKFIAKKSKQHQDNKLDAIWQPLRNILPRLKPSSSAPFTGTSTVSNIAFQRFGSASEFNLYGQIDDVTMDEIVEDHSNHLHDHSIQHSNHVEDEPALAISESNHRFHSDHSHYDESGHSHVGHSDDNQHCHDDSQELEHLTRNRKAMCKLVFGLVLCFVFMTMEIVGGWLSQSLAIFTDAAHLVSDLVSFAISLLAIYLGQKRPTKSKTFGYMRIEVIGVLFSVFIIWVMTGFLIYFAILRLIHHDYDLDTTVMLIVSSSGLVINIVMMCVLSDGFGCFQKCFRKGKNDKDESHGHHHEHNTSSTVNIVHDVSSEGDHGHGHSHSHGHSHFGHSHMNMNVRAAILHLLGDIVQSIGVLIAAIIIHFWPHLKAADPICTLIFGVIVLSTTYSIMNDTLHILMEGSPREIDYDHVRKLLVSSVMGVRHVHSLHVWSLTHGRSMLTVHLAVDPSIYDKNISFDQIRTEAARVIRTKLHIHQTTIQVELYQASEMVKCRTCTGPTE